MNGLYSLLWPVIVAIGGVGGIWLKSRLAPGARPSRREGLAAAPIDPRVIRATLSRR